jgi:RNA polymerase sigma factor (sigma-70 family)
VDRFCNPWWFSWTNRPKLEPFVASEPRQKKNRPDHVTKRLSASLYINVTSDCAPRPGSFDDLHQAYAVLLPRWFRRLRVPAVDADDAAQDVWLEVGTNPDQIPTDANGARKALFKLALRVAARLRERANDAENRRHPTTEPDHLATDANIEARACDALALLEQLDRLDETTRRMLIASKVLGYSDEEIGRELNMTAEAVRVRMWRACAQLSKSLPKRDERRGVLLAPGVLFIDDEIRAALCAIWSAEGRMPAFGGPKGPPPPPPPFLPMSKVGALPLSLPLGLTPKLVALALLVSLPLLGGLALILALLMRPRERPPLARSGLYTPAATLEIVCIAEPPSIESTPQKRTAIDTSTPPKPYAEPLDTMALEALMRTAFSPGKGRK